jgi:hypothetical protein
VRRGFWLALVVTAFGFGVEPPRVWALAFGPIEIQSDFGENFRAEIPVKSRDIDGLKIFLGSEEDYKKLDVKRSSIIDQLQIRLLRPEGRHEPIIEVTSQKPLFYPSFNLVVRVEEKGQEGAILENYLIAVDFQKSLALGMRGSKKNDPPGDAKKPEAAALVELTQPSEVRMSSVLEAPADDKATAPPAAVEKAAAVPPPVAQPVVVQPAIAPVQEPAKPRSEKNYGPVQNGETLWQISSKIKNDRQEAERVAVALWLDNKDQFLYENIHGLKAGAMLDYANVDARLAAMAPGVARKTIKTQLEEWKSGDAKKFAAPMSMADFSALETDFLAPGNDDVSEAMQVVQGWKKSWETGNLKDHMGFFKDPDTEEREWTNRYKQVRAMKERLMRHGAVALKVGTPVVVRHQDRLLVSFDQTYESGTMTTHGKKTLELAHIGGEWKIIGEWFKVKAPEQRGDGKTAKAQAKGKPSSPWVIHISAHADLGSATRVVNELRKNGFGAYSSLSFTAPGKRSYEVFVDRYPDWSVTETLVAKLRRLKIAEQAVPMSLPYSLDAGAYAREAEALGRVKELRQRGFSSFIFRTFDADAEVPVLRVLIGAYATAKEAGAVTKELQRSNIAAIITTL